MINILRRLFIKDYKNLDDSKVRTAHGKLAAGFGIFSNVILFGLKLFIGILSASVSIIADSINNLSDFGTSTISLLGFKMASKPADKEHPFGHQRIEYIAGLIVSIVIVALAIVLGYSSITKMISYDKTAHPTFSFEEPLPLIILGVAILLKVIQAIFNFRMAKIIKSVALKATGVDSLTDSIATTFILLSAIAICICHDQGVIIPFSLDGLVGILVACFVCFSGVKMIIETSSPLIGESTSIEEIKKITDEILSYEGVYGIHDLVAHNYGPTKIFMTLHVEVDSRIDVLESHERIDNIENEIRKKYDVELTIHMDPIEIDNPEINKYKDLIKSYIKDSGLNYSIHDFRMVNGKGHKNVIFDVIIPYEDKTTEKELVNKFEEVLNKDSKTKINVVLHVDRPFVER